MVGNRKIATNGRCGHPSHQGDGDFCGGDRSEHAEMACAKTFEIVSPSPAPKNPVLPIVKIDNLVISYQVSSQSDKYCTLGIDLKISKGAPAFWLRAIVRTHILYHPAKFQLYHIRCVGFESIGKFLRARPTAPPGKKSKNLAPQDCADWCLVSSNQV